MTVYFIATFAAGLLAAAAYAFLGAVKPAPAAQPTVGDRVSASS